MFTSCAAAAITLIVLQAPSARADTPAGPAVTVGSTTPDKVAGTLTLNDVKIDYPGEDGTITLIHRIVLKSLEQPADGTFKASEADISGLTMQFKAEAGLSLAVDAATVTNLEGPLPSSEKLSVAGSPGDIAPIADWLLALKFESAAIPAIALQSNEANDKSQFTYHDVAITGVDSGKVESFVASGPDGTSTGATPADAGKITVGKWDIEKLDLGIYATWFDDALAAAAPKEKRTVYKTFSIADIAIVGGDFTMGIDKFSADNFALAPPPMKPSEFITLLETAGADAKDGKRPEDTASTMAIAKFVRGIYSAFNVGALEVDGVKVAEAGKPPSSVGLVRLENFSGAKIGEIRLGDLDVTDDSDGTTVKLGSFAVRGFDVTDFDTIFLARIESGTSPDDLTIDQYPKPRVTGIALADLDAVIPGQGHFTLGGFTLDTPDWVGFLPTSIKGRIEGFSMPIDSIDDADARDQFKSFGLDAVTFNAGLDIGWNADDQTVTLGSFSADIDGLGRTEVAGKVGGVPKSVFENPTTAEAAIATLDFRAASFSAQDGGSFPKLVDLAAKQQNLTREALAEQSSSQIETAVATALGMQDAAKKIGAAIKTFILDPKSLTIAINAIEPIPAAAIIQAGNGDQPSIDLIKKSIHIEAKVDQ